MRIHTKIIIDIESNNIVYEEGFDYKGPLALCGGGKGGGGVGGDSVVTQRYADYVEQTHSNLLYYTQDRAWEAIANNPYADYEDIDIEAAFFGAGYTIGRFPSLYDMYGKFVAGLDVCALHAQIFEDTVNAPEVHNLVAAEAALMDDDLDASILPRFKTGMRDINSVMSSSFVIGKAVILDGRGKSLDKFSAELKYRLIPVATDRWKEHLGWNKDVVMTYAEIMKLYYSAKMDTDDTNCSMKAKHQLWPFTALEYVRAMLGVLQGATTTTSETAGTSRTQRAIGGALSGAATGAYVGSKIGSVGGPMGAGIGALLGLGSAFL